ncbi:MAG: hypothetical protein KAS02_02530 [Candidatus Pacebacteria bacterium]|nr:hypothetical protein [Candidatus Paceibacterota bacterium]
MLYLYQDIESGIWKFRQKVKPERLIEIALEWAGEAKGEWVDLHVRRCSGNQIGLGFKYVRPKNETPVEFFERITDLLKRQFGNDFVGWDVGHQTWMIKQGRYKISED